VHDLDQMWHVGAVDLMVDLTCVQYLVTVG